MTTASVVGASCDCKASAMGRCNHVAALLFALEDFTVQFGFEGLACTSDVCKWNVGRKKKKNPKPAHELRYNKKSAPDRIIEHDPRPTTSMTQDAEDDFINTFIKTLPSTREDSVFEHVLEIKYDEYEVDEADLRQMVDAAAELFREGFDSAAPAFEVDNTREQSDSPAWQEARYCRVTASNAKDVISMGMEHLDYSDVVNFRKKQTKSCGLVSKCVQLNVVSCSVWGMERVMDRSALDYGSNISQRQASVGIMTEEKRPAEEKHFAILTKDSIKVIAEAAGYADLPDDAASILGEDVSYRLREMTQNSSQFMKHSKRKRLTTEDFNKALRQSNVQPVFGNRAQEALPFRQTSDGELHFVEDLDANFSNIAFNSYIPKSLGETTIKAHWLAVEGVQKQVTLSQANQGKVQPKKEITEDLQLYYDNVTNAILGFDEEVMKVALGDLRSNPQIVPLLPFFVNFVSNGVKKVSHDISQLTKLLHTVKALINNPNLYLEPHPYLSLLVKGVMYCVTEPLAASINPTNDHWVLRDYAARLLGQIVHCWSSPVNHLRYNTVKTMKEVLYDHTKPFCSHYGAVMGLLSLGYQCLEDVLVPHLSSYWPHLSSVLEDPCSGSALARSDASKVYGAILLSVELLIQKKMKETDS
ncbi:hypothetical protein ScPMuIL_013998 [Solemya velum]